MTPIEALQHILQISYRGHPDGRADRLEMIERYARQALEDARVADTRNRP